MSELNKDVLNCLSHDNVRTGTVAVIMFGLGLEGSELLYAGPITSVPESARVPGAVILMSPEDYDRIDAHMKKVRQ